METNAVKYYSRYFLIRWIDYHQKKMIYNLKVDHSKKYIKEIKCSPMSIEAKFAPIRKNFTWSFSGNIIFTASQLGILIFIAKVGNPEMLGQYGLGVAISAPVLMFLSLQLRSVLASDARDEYSFGSYLGMCYLTNTIALIIILCVIFLSNYKLETSIIIIIVSAVKILDAKSELLFGLIQKNERMDLIARSYIIRGIGSLAVVGVVLLVTGNLFLALISMACSRLIVLLSYDIKCGKLFANCGAYFDKNILCNVAWLSTPLGIAMGLMVLNSHIPRYFLHSYYGESSVGYYTALSQITFGTAIVVRSLGQSVFTRFSKFYAENYSQFERLLHKMIAVSVMLGSLMIIFVWILGEPFLAIVYNLEYAKFNNVFFVLSIGAAINFFGSIIWFALTATRKFNFLPIGYGLITIGTLCACAYLIPRYQIMGAALAFLVTSLFNILVLCVLLCWSCRNKI